LLLGSLSAVADEAGPLQKVPSEQERLQAETDLRDVFGDRIVAATTNEQRMKLSQDLERQGLDESNSPAVQFVALEMARTLALDAKDTPRALELIDALAKGFDVRGTEKKALLMAELLRQGSSSERAEQLVTGEVLMQQLVDADAYDDAITVGRAALETARAVRDKDAIDRILNFGRGLGAKRETYIAAQKALARLKTDPNDAQANTAVGRWYWFIKNDVDQGLAHLARGDDAKLAEAARQDLALPIDAKARLDLAEKWQKLAASQKPEAREVMLARAKLWYEQALPHLGGLDKARAAKQLAAMDKTVATTKKDSPKEEEEEEKPDVAWKPPGRNGRALFRTFLGVYLYKSDESKMYPVINLEVPNKNLWTQQVQDKVRGRIPFEEISYLGTAKIAVPEDGIYVLDANECRVSINGMKTGGSGDINIRRGIHTLTLTSETHGQPHIVHASITLRHKETGEEVPFFNSWAEIQRFAAARIGGKPVMEVSDWMPTEVDEVNLNTKTLRVEP
jgi:hypothetical protein